MAENENLPEAEELTAVKKGLVPSREETTEKEAVVKEKPMSNCFFHYCGRRSTS